MDMVPNCISEKAHAGDGHDGRNHLLFSIDILGCVRSVLDIVVPVVGYLFLSFDRVQHQRIVLLQKLLITGPDGTIESDTEFPVLE